METGLILFPSAIASGLMMPISGALFDKYGAKVVTIPGLIIVAFATYEMSMFNMNTSMSTITLVATLRGIGLGFAMMPVNTAGLNDVPRHLYGKATALSTTVRSILSALAITFMTTMISTKSSDNYARLTEQITPFNHASNSLLKGLQGIYMKNGLTQGDAQGSALTTLGKMICAQAYLDAINYVIAITVFAVVIAIFLVLMMRSSKKPKNKEPEKSLVKGEVLDGAGSEARIATILE